MTADKEIVNLLKDIKKQNNTIIKILRNIDNGVCEVNGYDIDNGVNKEFFGNDSDSKNS
jgi:hypothetical protein